MPSRAATGQSETEVTRRIVAEQISARLGGRLSDAALASWAFERFYAVELGEATLEPGAEQLIADVLDELMFGDDPDFRLGEAELGALLERLTATR
jgi:hypothetical protein